MNPPYFSALIAIFYFGWLWFSRSSAEERAAMKPARVAASVQRQKQLRQISETGNCIRPSAIQGRKTLSPFLQS